jgi:hypothetical protein
MFYSIISLSKNVIKKESIKKVVVWYPVLPVILGNFLSDVSFYVVYVAPVLPSLEFPSVFDSILKSRKFKLYSKTSKNIISSESFIKKINFLPFSGKTPEDQMTNTSITHLMCVNKVIVPKYNPVYKFKKGKYIRLNSIIDKGKSIAPTLEVQKLVESLKGENLVMLSFGSFGKIPEVRDNLYKILDTFEKSKYTVIFHQPPKDLDISKYSKIKVVNGFIPYPWIVKYLELVVFTGSICLQDTCILNKTKMIMCPLLSEQFLWAKNYQYHTGQQYFNIITEPKSVFKEALVNLQINKQEAFLEKASKSMLRIDTAKRILQIVEK